MRNTILTLAIGGPLTFLALTPSLAEGVCDAPFRLECPIYGAYESGASRAKGAALHSDDAAAQ